MLVGGLGSSSDEAAIDALDTVALGYARPDVIRFSYLGGRVPDATDGFSAIAARAYDSADTQVDLRTSAAALADLLEQVAQHAPGTTIDVLAHSQGGVVTRLALSELEQRHVPTAIDQVGLVATLGTPHRGADLATAVAAIKSTHGGSYALAALGALLPAGIDAGSPAVAQLAETSDLIDSLKRTQIPPGIESISIAARTDLVVPVPRTELPEHNRWSSTSPVPWRMTSCPGTRRSPTSSLWPSVVHRRRAKGSLALSVTSWLVVPSAVWRTRSAPGAGAPRPSLAERSLETLGAHRVGGLASQFGQSVRSGRSAHHTSSSGSSHGRPTRRWARISSNRGKEAAVAVVTMKQLLEAGVHFGHQTRRWNPKMKRFIFGERNGIYIIDLQQTLRRIEDAYTFVRDLVADGGEVLFIGTKKQAQDPIQSYAEKVGMPYINQRWLGGMLTNFETISKRVGKMQEYRRMRSSGEFDAMPKKEALLLGARAREAGAQPRWHRQDGATAPGGLHPRHQEGAHRGHGGQQAGHADRGSR